MSINNYFNYQLLKDSLKMMNPVALTLIGAIIFTFFVVPAYVPDNNTQPEQINFVKSPSNPQENPVGATGAALANALIFVVITLIGGLIFVLFIKYGLGKLMNFLLAGVFALSIFAFSILIIPAILVPILNNWVLPILPEIIAQFIVDQFLNLILILSLIFAAFYIIGFTVIKNQYLHNTLMIVFGMSMGTIFGVFFDSFSLIAVLLALSLYDIYAVFKGPLKEMFEELDMKSDESTRGNDTFIDVEPSTKSSLEEQEPSANIYGTSENGYNNYKPESNSILKPRYVKNPQIANGFTLPVYATPFITIGLGDFAFFSVLIAKATYLALRGDFFFLPATNGAIFWSLIILPFIGILIGSYLTFVLLQKYQALPALPLPISCGLLGLFLGMLLQIL